MSSYRIYCALIMAFCAGTQCVFVLVFLHEGSTRSATWSAFFIVFDMFFCGLDMWSAA